MDHDDDVERLFSWIRTPDLHYREFASERDVADAVEAWPVPRNAADQTGHRPRDAEADGAPTSPAPQRTALGGRLASLFRHREPPPPPEPPPVYRQPETHEPPPEHPVDEAAWVPEPPRPSPIFARLRPAAEPASVQVPPSDADYQGFEEDGAEPAVAETADPSEARSLDAIFSRLSHPAPTAPQERNGAAVGVGLGSVFRRLR